MLQIKIQCVCGRSYAFEVEPVSGRMPRGIRCPTCGADGTAAANEALARAPLAKPSSPAPAAALPRVAAPIAAAPRVTAPTGSVPPPLSKARAPSAAGQGRPLLPGQPTRAQALHEARAKMLWGDSYEEVVQFLRMQGYSEAEAAAAVAKMFEERLAIIRANGIQSIVIGSILVFVPVAGFLVLLGMNSISLRLLPIPLLFGIWGVWLVVKGVLMVFAPKSEMGDASRM